MLFNGDSWHVEPPFRLVRIQMVRKLWRLVKGKLLNFCGLTRTKLRSHQDLLRTLMLTLLDIHVYDGLWSGPF